MSLTKYLITGGAGNIGSALALELSKNRNNQIVIIDNFLTGSGAKIPKRDNVIFIKADVNNYKDIVPNILFFIIFACINCKFCFKVL